MAVTGMGTKLRKTAAAAVLFALAMSGVSEASNYVAETIAEFEIILAYEPQIRLWEYFIENNMEDLIEEEKEQVKKQGEIWSVLLAMNRRIEEQYGDDHQSLPSGDRALDGGGGLLLPWLPAPAAVLPPGYREPGSNDVIDFSKAYKDGMKEWKDYSSTLMSAILLKTYEVKAAQGTIADAHKALENAGFYRRLMQAGNHATLLSAREAENLRVDMEKQIEARAKFVLEERQERTDAHAAFKQALRERRLQPGFGLQGY